MLEFKNYKAEVGEDGQITGYFSTYNDEPDYYGDVVAPGAFTESIKAREASGHPFPLCWNHDLDQIIGEVKKIEDTEKGPLMTASFFDFPNAQEKRALVKSGVVYQFSFAYEVVEAEPIKLKDGTIGRLLKRLNLFEITIAPIPANPSAEVTEIKAGRRNSKADEDKLRAAINLLGDALGYLTELAGEEQAEEQAEENANNDELSSVEEVQEEVNAAAEEQKSEDNSENKRALLDYISTFKKGKANES